ncbi:MAG: hypothetical protein KDC57_04590 [Saprospiraceae bacterium]|nr:hypothetical protein [Saprospiraceae bacterium]
MKTKLRMALKIWLAIYPSITLFLYLFSEILSGYSLPVRTLIITVVLVPWLIFAGMPALDFIQNIWVKKTNN